MKKQILLWICCYTVFNTISAQMVLSSGNNFLQTGGYLVLKDMSLVNYGSFNPTGGTVRFSGTGNNSISGTNSPAFNILEIDKTTGNQLDLQQHISVNNSIHFLSGLIELAGRNIILNGTAYLDNETENSRITGIIGGYVQATATLNAPASVNPGNLGAVISTTENLGFTTIRRGHMSQQNAFGNGSSLYRYFDILPGAPPSLFSLRINYFDAELNGHAESELAIWKSNDTLLWLLQGYTGRNTTGNYVEYGGINYFNQRWTLAEETAVLPLTLLSFRANCQAGAANLNWNTIGNADNETFEVQRSSDGAQWQTIAIMQAGTRNQYNYTDVPNNAASKYRLKLFADNRIIYSQVTQADCSTIAKNNTVIYPNPATNVLQLQLSNMPDKEILLTLYSNSGQVLVRKKISVGANIETYTLPLTDLPAGIYRVNLQSPAYNKTLAFIKQ